LAPDLLAFKNTVESDQETSLVQAFWKYINLTGDQSILKVKIGDETAESRLDRALHYLMHNRFDLTHGLLWSGVTVDWGDVQAGAGQVTLLDKHSPRAIGIYNNAMLYVALRDFLTFPELDHATTSFWNSTLRTLNRTIRRWLWDSSRQQYRAHIYLDGSPFPAGFDDAAVFVHGGTTVAIEAGLLSTTEVKTSLAHMDADVKAAGANSIGLSVYPPYPATAFSASLSGTYAMGPYSYQNGGDWDWFGGRMVQQLILRGLEADAYREITPMIRRVRAVGSFYEWWTRYGGPRGTAGFRGAGGELGLAAWMLITWAETVP
jgi:hypothetical protein